MAQFRTMYCPACDQSYSSGHTVDGVIVATDHAAVCPKGRGPFTTLDRLNKVKMGFSATASAWIGGKGSCEVCEAKEVKLLKIDLSGGEYGDLFICRGCLLNLAEVLT